MEKQRKDAESARKSAGLDKGNTNGSLADPWKNSTTAGNNVLDRRRYARMAPYPELDEEEFTLDGTSPSRAYRIDDDSDDDADEIISPDFRTSSKRPSPYHSDDNSCKRSRTSDFETVDLTDSPPSSQHRGYSSYSEGRRESHRAGQAPFERPKNTDPSDKFTLDDCSEEQKHILNLVSQGKNVFFTGSAGVGKSFVLTKISQLLKSKGQRQFHDFFITASTGTSLWREKTDLGIAAVHIGGTTVHSFAGIGKGEDGVLDLRKKVKFGRRTRRYWDNCKTLVIDEVSMVRHHFILVNSSYLMIYLINWMELENLFARTIAPSVVFNLFSAEISISFLQSPYSSKLTSSF
jgi:hypothetical protein